MGGFLQEGPYFPTGRNSGPVPGTSSNQYGLLPGMPAATPPSTLTPVGGSGSGLFTESPTDPTLTNEFNAWLQSQVGKGAKPFNLTTPLATGGSTVPGAVNAPMNPILQILQKYFSGGGNPSGVPGLDTLSEMAKTGDPTNMTPAWQAAVAAAQRNIDENANKLREQFAFGGDLKSSPFGTAESDFFSQTAKDQNAAFLAAQAQADEAAAGRKLSASDTLISAQQELGTLFQNMDQQDVQNVLNEFIRTNPEYSPLLNLMASQANAYQPIVSNKGYGTSTLAAILSGAAGILGPVATKALTNLLPSKPAAPKSPVVPATPRAPADPTVAPDIQASLEAAGAGAASLIPGIGAGVGAGAGAAVPGLTPSVSTNLITDPAEIASSLGGASIAGAGAAIPGLGAGPAAGSIVGSTLTDEAGNILGSGSTSTLFPVTDSASAGAASIATSLLSALPVAAVFLAFDALTSWMGGGMHDNDAANLAWGQANPLHAAQQSLQFKIDELGQQLDTAGNQRKISKLQEALDLINQKIAAGGK